MDKKTWYEKAKEMFVKRDMSLFKQEYMNQLLNEDKETVWRSYLSDPKYTDDNPYIEEMEYHSSSFPRPKFGESHKWEYKPFSNGDGKFFRRYCSKCKKIYTQISVICRNCSNEMFVIDNTKK